MATNEGNRNDEGIKLALYKAAISGDWEKAASLQPTKRTLNKRGETALHIATAASHTRFVEKLVGMIPESDKEFLAIRTIPTAIAPQTSSLAQAVVAAPTAFEIREDLTTSRRSIVAALESANAKAHAAQQENAQATTLVTIERQVGSPVQAANTATTSKAIAPQASSPSEAIPAAPTLSTIEEDPSTSEAQAESATTNTNAAQQENAQATTVVTVAQQVRVPIQAATSATTSTAIASQASTLGGAGAVASESEDQGNTAFCYAAISGNVKIAQIMREKKTDLPKVRGGKGFLPIYMAALAGHAEMVRQLYKLHRDDNQLKLEDGDLVSLLIALVESDIYDIALEMIEDRPELATKRDEKNRQGETALHAFARKPCIPSIQTSTGIWSYCRNFFSDRRKHEQGLRLVQKLWEKVILLKEHEVSDLMILPSGKRLIFIAAENGNVEFLTILIRQYPDLVLKVDDNQYTIFHIAVLNRHEKIFRLILQLGMMKNLINLHEDANGNNILHLAGKLPPPSRLNIIRGAALQLQHELLWFEEVKKVVRPGQIAEKNLAGKTAREVFMDAHEDLRKKAEKWMINTANSCMLVATLIATVVFAAAFTVPGGNGQGTGIPIFVRDTLFKIFAIADAVSLASSTSSILSFLSILTSRFSMDDFLKSLPRKLICGLLFLFVAIITMMVAFVLAFFFIFKHGLIQFAISISALASIPIVLFIWQLFLVYEMIRSTYMCSFVFCSNNETLFPTKSKFPRKLCCSFN
ncbi:ankyrin repeat-containing protein At5g02620 isoform X2 [Manihot esculenta]|uniref:ankyrin repeat-containing protein At5g02620 isoform X2 n=1 Tax=Manihot esculenta TaxID=3983 RepID=UPI001CC7D33A|nr:ankyrin repeat-containing protein At5g02620 isoform X2 [Manihot esculenta]